MLIGYARVSTTAQLLDRQLRALDDAGCVKVFSDQLSGRDADRPQLRACLAYLRAGDTLVVPSLDRLSRSLQDLITLVAQVRLRGIGFARCTRTSTPPPGWAAGVSRLRRVGRVNPGAHRRWDPGGPRGPAGPRGAAGPTTRDDPEQVRHVRDLLSHPNNTVSSIARLLNVSGSTIYKYVPELGGRADDTAQVLDTALAADTRPPLDVTKYDDLLPSRRPPSGGR